MRSILLAAATLPLFGQPNLSILLPERTRLLEDQQLDLVIEARNIGDASDLRVTANGADITSRFKGPLQADLDCNGGQDAVFRADLTSFPSAGNVRLVASLGGLRDARDIIVMPFSMARQRRNIILMIGDAMDSAYRDAGRIVAGAFLFTGYMDQTDLFFKMAAALGDTTEADALIEKVLGNPRYPRTFGK